MTKAELIAKFSDMPDDAEIIVDTRRNSLEIKDVSCSKPKNCIWISVDYSNEDEEVQS